MAVELLLTTFSGPRSNLSAVVGEFATEGIPSTVHDGAPRFHATDADGAPIVTDAGAPVFEEDLTVDVLCADLDRATEIAERSGFALRMHGPSGFSSLAEADAVAAGMHEPNPAVALVDTLRRAVEDPHLAGVVRDLLGVA